MDTWGFAIGLGVGIFVTGLTAIGLFIWWVNGIMRNM